MTDFAREKRTLRDRLLATLSDHDWHGNRELCRPDCGGPRFTARMLELRRLGYRIESRFFNGTPGCGKEYRLLTDRGKPLGKSVKIYLDEADAMDLAEGRPLREEARRNVSDALVVFEMNRHKL